MKKTILNINRNISYNYYIKERYECGIVLLPKEVKFIKHNGCNIIGSYVNFIKLECWLINLYINNFRNDDTIMSNRKKKLLLNKNEIKHLLVFAKTKGNTIIPSSIYWKNTFIKLELCLGTGKKLYDKRSLLRRKEWELAKQKINLT